MSTFGTSNIPFACGNGVLDEGEACDGTLLGDATCSSVAAFSTVVSLAARLTVSSSLKHAPQMHPAIRVRWSLTKSVIRTQLAVSTA